MSYRSPFSRRLLGEMMRRRAAVERGDRGARTSPLRARWQDNVYPPLRPEAEARYARGELPLHDYAHALNSSQAFAMNLFLAPAVGPSASLDALLSGTIGDAVSVGAIDLEFYGSGDLLAEIPEATPTADDRLTAADVALHLRRADGAAGVLLVEVKLTESGFTTCGGARSRGNRDLAPCRDAAVFFDDPDRCYLRRPKRAVRDRRYWTIFGGSHGSLRAAFPGAATTGPCPFVADWQQPMRNHALLLGMQEAGRVQFGHLALVHHDHNPDVVGPWDAYAAATADRDRIHRLPASALIDALGAGLPDPADYARWMRERYVLEET